MGGLSTAPLMAFEDLPEELWVMIFSFLPVHDLYSMMLSCRFFHKIVVKDWLWFQKCKDFRLCENISEPVEKPMKFYRDNACMECKFSVVLHGIYDKGWFQSKIVDVKIRHKRSDGYYVQQALKIAGCPWIEMIPFTEFELRTFRPPQNVTKVLTDGPKDEMKKTLVHQISSWNGEWGNTSLLRLDNSFIVHDEFFQHGKRIFPSKVEIWIKGNALTKHMEDWTTYFSATSASVENRWAQRILVNRTKPIERPKKSDELDSPRFDKSKYYHSGWNFGKISQKASQKIRIQKDDMYAISRYYHYIHLFDINGFEVEKMKSPYYASSPIIIQFDVKDLAEKGMLHILFKREKEAAEEENLIIRVLKLEENLKITSYTYGTPNISCHYGALFPPRMKKDTLVLKEKCDYLPRKNLEESDEDYIDRLRKSGVTNEKNLLVKKIGAPKNGWKKKTSYYVCILYKGIGARLIFEK